MHCSTCIHSRALGQAFVMVGPQNNSGTLEPTVHGDTERDWALRLGVKRAVDGWLAPTRRAWTSARAPSASLRAKASGTTSTPGTASAPPNTCARLAVWH